MEPPSVLSDNSPPQYGKDVVSGYSCTLQGMLVPHVMHRIYQTDMRGVNVVPCLV